MPSARRVRHDRTAAALAARGDAGLAALLDAVPVWEVGVGGGSATFDVGGVPVFAKRIPLTDRERARPHDTGNLFDLPLFCQYGVGGPGFGAWRELAANHTVTAAVLAGGTRSFPLLHHWRVLPGRPPVAAEHADLDAVVARLDGSPAVRTRLEELAAATCSLVLFFEHVPYPLRDVLRADPVGTAEPLHRQLSEVVAVLRSRDLLHLDGHFGNLRTDGRQLHLTDFGLATSPRFALSDPERAFARRHADHDARYAAMCLVNWLVTTVCGIEVPATGDPTARNEYVRRCAAGDVPADLPPTVAALLTRHAPAAATMNDFYRSLFGGDLHTPYPD